MYRAPCSTELPFVQSSLLYKAPYCAQLPLVQRSLLYIDPCCTELPVVQSLSYRGPCCTVSCCKKLSIVQSYLLYRASCFTELREDWNCAPSPPPLPFSLSMFANVKREIYTRNIKEKRSALDEFRGKINSSFFSVLCFLRSFLTPVGTFHRKTCQR